MNLPTFLSGQFKLTRGSFRDYLLLERFHYRPRRPRTYCAIWVVQYLEPDAIPTATGRRLRRRIAAVGVLSHPYIYCAPRNRVLGLHGTSQSEKLRFANRYVRTITRVIVHPQFRSLGLAAAIVRCLCEHCPTRYVEATAAMGRVHPFFERAGMTRYEPATDEEPAYFLLDRRQKSEFRNPNPRIKSE